jgi:hypothetical protein
MLGAAVVFARQSWDVKASTVVRRSGRALSPLSSSVNTTQQQHRQQHHHQQHRRSFSDNSPAKKRISNVKKKEKKSKDDNVGVSGRSRDLEVLLACLDAPKTSRLPPPDEEERARRGRILRAYTVGKFQQHNRENHDVACKLRMKEHAIHMLPRNSKLRNDALRVDDDSFPPPWRRIPAWTPPIPGFNPSEFAATEE